MFQTLQHVSVTTERSRCIRDIGAIPQIPQEERAKLRRVAERYPFHANTYYLGLIDWDDPRDPMRQIVIPQAGEVIDWGDLDPSNESDITVAPGLQHKYDDTALLLCSRVCGASCRYCFRKRLFLNDNGDVADQVTEGLAYIAKHAGISDVLLTGGDSLAMGTQRLVRILESLRDIAHVKIIRIGSKMPASDPWRLLNDTALQGALRRFSTRHRRIYLMAHFDHPRELTDVAIEGIACLIRSGVICVNQCPLVRGVSDDPEVLAALFRKLSFIGCPPYYLFQCRPAVGNAPFAVPIVRGWEIFNEALRQGAGLARRARFVMSHETGKIEFLAVDKRHVYLRYHRAKAAALRGQFMIYRRDDQAYWLDELEPAQAYAAPTGRSAHQAAIIGAR